MTIMALPRGIWSNDYFAMDESNKKHINIGHLEHYSQCLALFIPATKEQNQVINILRLVL